MCCGGGKQSHRHMFTCRQRRCNIRLRSASSARDSETYAGQCLTTSSPGDMGAEGRYVVFTDFCGVNTPVMASFTQATSGHRAQAQMQCFSLSFSWAPKSPTGALWPPLLSIRVGLLVLESSLGGAFYAYISDWNISHKKSVLLTATKKKSLCF